MSLNLEARIAENKRLEEERLARENARRAAVGMPALPNISELDASDGSDAIVLRQAARVVAEIAERRRGSSAQTVSR